MKWKITIMILMAIVIAMATVATAYDFDPGRDINLRDIYDIKNAVDIETACLNLSGDYRCSWIEIGEIPAHNALSGLQGGTTDQYYHLNQSVHDTVISKVFSWITAAFFDQDLNTTDSVTFVNITASNITADYYSGQPIDGSIGSGIIYSSSNKAKCACINATDMGGRNVWYPELTVRIWSFGEEVNCNISSDTVTILDNAHQVYYVNSSCGVTNMSWENYFAQDLNPASYVRIFDVYTKEGDIEVVKGSSIMGMVDRKTRWVNVNCGKGGHLSICEGIDVEENTFPDVNQTAGTYNYVHTVHTSAAKQASVDGIHITVASDGSHTAETGINLSACDSGYGPVVCSDNKYRRYVIYTIGFGAELTKIHQLAPLDGVTYKNIGECADLGDNPFSYTLPDEEYGVAVFHHIYCGRRDDSSWSGAWLDIRGDIISAGPAIDTSIFLTTDGARPLTDNWDAGAFNITADYFFGNGSQLTGIVTTETDPLWTSNSTLIPYLASANTFTANNIFNQNLTVDTDTLFVDSNIDRVGIGTKDPGRELEVYATVIPGIRMSGNRDGGLYGQLEFVNRNSTVITRAIVGATTDGTNDSSRLNFYTEASGEVASLNMVIDSGGNVGIGTTSPGAKLDISHDAASGDVLNIASSADEYFKITQEGYVSIKSLNHAGVYIRAGNVSSYPVLGLIDEGSGSAIQWNIAHGQRGDGILSFELGGARMVINGTSGNVGVGTITPQNKLNVVGDINFTGLIYGNGSQLTDISYTETDPLWTGNWTDVAFTNIDETFDEKLTVTKDFVADPSGNVLYVNSTSHKVGVGTSNPFVKFTVQDGNILIDRTDASNAVLRLRNVNDEAQIYLHSTEGDIRFYNDADLMTIQPDGDVGIGTTSPQNKLNVIGDLNVTSKSYMTDVDFNGGWGSGGFSIIGGDIYAQTGYFYNITGLDVQTLKVNGSIIPQVGFDNQFDLGSSSLRWNDLFLGGKIYAGDWTNVSITESQISDLQEYYLKSNPFSFYNSSDFSIADYYLKSNPFGFFNTTTDGSGSGLDADLLDGQHYSDIIDYKYHAFSNGDYYYDDYQQGNYLRLFTESATYDTVRFQPYSDVEYWNESWVAWADGNSTIETLLDGREDTQQSIDHTHRKFRFVVTRNSGWPTMCLIILQGTWTGIVYPGINVSVETYNGTDWNLKETALFDSSHTGSNHGVHLKASSNLHDGKTPTRVTINITNWTDNDPYFTIPLKRFMLLSNFAGGSLIPFSWDYDKAISMDGDLDLGDNDLENIGTVYHDDTTRYFNRLSSDGTEGGTLYNAGSFWNTTDNYLRYRGYSGVALDVQTTNVLTSTAAAMTIVPDLTLSGDLTVGAIDTTYQGDGISTYTDFLVVEDTDTSVGWAKFTSISGEMALIIDDEAPSILIGDDGDPGYISMDYGDAPFGSYLEIAGGRISIGSPTPWEAFNVEGNIFLTGTVNASSFNGSGTGLTGTASSLTCGAGDSATGFFSSGSIPTTYTDAKCTSAACNDAVYSEATIQSVCTDCIGDAQLLYNTGQALTTGSSPTFVNLNSISAIYGDFGTIARSYDEWLRLNDGGTHTSGIYTSLKLRADGGLYVSDDEYWYAGAEDRIDTTDNVYLSAITYLGVTGTYFNTAGTLVCASCVGDSDVSNSLTASWAPDHGTGTTDMLSNVIYTSGACSSTGASTTTIGTICVEY